MNGTWRAVTRPEPFRVLYIVKIEDAGSGITTGMPITMPSYGAQDEAWPQERFLERVMIPMQGG